MSSEATGAAKKRVASVERRDGSAAWALELAASQVSVSQQELKDARGFLRGLEEKFGVIDADSDDSCYGLAGCDNGMSSESIGAAKRRVASAERWAGSAARALELAASQVSAWTSWQELENAREFLRGLEEKFESIDVDSDDSCDGLADHDNGRAEAARATDKKDRSTSCAMTMEIPVRSLVGPSGSRTYTLEVGPSDTIRDIKAKIEDKEGYKSSKLEVILAPRGNLGRLFSGDRTAADCGIDADSSLWVYEKIS